MKTREQLHDEAMAHHVRGYEHMRAAHLAHAAEHETEARLALLQGDHKRVGHCTGRARFYHDLADDYATMLAGRRT